MTVNDLPALNAALNATSFILLVTGYAFIRRKQWRQHRACMIAALVMSGLFLTSYLIYHANAGSKPYAGTGFMRTVYFAVLIPHVILAAVILPLQFITLARGLKMDRARHRKIARITLPLWLYVSVTGVIVYLMLY